METKSRQTALTLWNAIERKGKRMSYAASRHLEQDIQRFADNLRSAAIGRSLDMYFGPSVIEYTNWAGDFRRWDSVAHARYFVITDRAPTDGTRTMSFEFGGAATCLGKTPEESAQQFAALVAQYPAYNWYACNPRVVNAPCAFDAHKVGITVRQLEVI